MFFHPFFLLKKNIFKELGFDFLKIQSLAEKDVSLQVIYQGPWIRITL